MHLRPHFVHGVDEEGFKYYNVVILPIIHHKERK